MWIPWASGGIARVRASESEKPVLKAAATKHVVGSRKPKELLLMMTDEEAALLSQRRWLMLETSWLSLWPRGRHRIGLCQPQETQGRRSLASASLGHSAWPARRARPQRPPCRLHLRRCWRGYVARHMRGTLNLAGQLHLGYELRVLQMRRKRRRLIFGFVQHLLYMGLLLMVFMLQHGRTVNTRRAPLTPPYTPYTP